MATRQPLPLEWTRLAEDPSRGISTQQAKERLTRYGPNLLTPEQRGSGLRRFLEPLRDPMVIILIVSGAIFLGLGQMSDGSIMLAAIVPIIIVDLALEIRAERTLERLRIMTASRALVRREGRELRIPSIELVIGDVVLLQEGDVVPADGVVESESNFQVDESSLTGESLPVIKKGLGWPIPEPAAIGPQSRIFAGTTVLSGRATVIVTATGEHTEYGKIGTLVATTGTQLTPIQRAIGSLVKVLGVVALFVSVAVAIFELTRGAGITNAILAAVSLAIAAIPEEFSIIFAIYLTIGAWRMARHNALVRRLAGVETLGSTTVICTDKTGTLTQGRLSVGGLFAGGQSQTAPFKMGGLAIKKLLEDAILASEPNPFDPLDLAISALAKENGIDPSTVFSRWTMVQDYPFDPQNKNVTHVWRSQHGEIKVCSKGSIEGMLSISMPPEDERKILFEVNKAFSNRGMRVIAVAEKAAKRVTEERWADESGLKIVGLIGFVDPLREGVRKAITECQTAGVRVIMITGDHQLTAHAIAESAGIAHKDRDVLTGPELDRMDNEALRRALGKVAIFARVLPTHKYRIVQGLKAESQIVAVTGDGINDAPALRAADIGVAMGRRGTEVAREAATMVLLDDNFGTIVEAIRLGRHIFDSLKRAFLYLITFHYPIVFVTFLIPIIGAPLLLLPIHLVWLELIIHPTSALVFESDPPPPDLMRRPPRNPREPLITRKMGVFIVVEGTAILLGALLLYLGLIGLGASVEQARAAGIIVLVVAQSILVLQMRSLKRAFWHLSILDNPTLIPALFATLASLSLMIYFGPLAYAAQLAAPTAPQWIVAVGIAFVTTVSFEWLKG